MVALATYLSKPMNATLITFINQLRTKPWMKAIGCF
jgi:hypothetical protein